MACLGPFCGYFRDELEADSSDEEEDGDGRNKASSKMRDKKKKVKKWKRPAKKEEHEGKASAKMKWGQYLNTVNVKLKGRGGMDTSLQVIHLRVNNNPHLSHGMMNSIAQLSMIHTIEITRCQREDIPPFMMELDTLAVFKMSHNRLRQFSEDLAKCLRLEQIILDWNDISEIRPGIFSTRTFAHLEVVNIAHNSLRSLPNDFGITKSSSIRHIDLSHNSIQSIPSSIVNCKNLEELNLSHNRLKALPENFKLQKLQKLFVSFNELTCLPQDIGMCISLIKIRMIDNQVRELPPSIIELWQKKPGGRGRLDEFLVDRNPLVMPSITAFSMDGGNHDRAFHLFYEHLKELEDEKKKQESVKAIEHEQAAAIEDQKQLAAAEEQALKDAAAAAAVEARPEEAVASPMDYYFAHCNKDPQQIAAIRDAESTLLLIKKNMFLKKQRILVLEALEEDEPVPENLSVFQEVDYEEKFNGIVPVKDVDIYFCLLVFSMKPQFPTCSLLFRKYEDGDKGYLTRQEWEEFCMAVPIYLEESMRQLMWEIMAYRRPDQVPLNDFVAAWQIHDIEAKDPWIFRMAQVLHLSYYDMTVKELQTRLGAKAGRDATPQLDFNDQASPRNAREALTDASCLENAEGLRLARHAGQAEQPSSARARTDAQQRGSALKITLSDAQYQTYERQCHEQEGDSDGVASEASLNSLELSEGSESEDSEFDAQAAMVQTEAQETREAQQAARVVIDSDDAIKQLMEMPVGAFFAREAASGAPALDAPKPAAKPKTKRELQPEQDNESHARTFAVRQALRRTYRNMPHSDFVSLINYLLRALQMIKHRSSLMYWHVDDPSFKHTLGAKGTNAYTRKLWGQVGFVKLNDTYWVWPNTSLDPAHTAGSAGGDMRRLDDMISLLKSCQTALHKTGSSFTGHVAFPH